MTDEAVTGYVRNPTAHMSSALRTFEILEAVSRQQPVTLSELVKSFPYSKSTVQRSLTTLEAAGWIRQVGPNNPSWEVTARSLTVRPRSLEGNQLYTRAQQPMTHLRDQTNETIHLSILDRQRGMVLIDRVDCSQVVRTFSPLGDVSPIHATSIGRAVLAYLPEHEIDRVLSGPLSQYTDRTIHDEADIRAELHAIRERGFSINIGEYRSSVCAIGAPIFDADGAPIGGLCISTPAVRFDESNIPTWGVWAREAAAAISLSAR